MTPPLFAQSTDQSPKSSMFASEDNSVDVESGPVADMASGPWAKTEGTSPFEENPSPGFAETLFKQGDTSEATGAVDSDEVNPEPKDSAEAEAEPAEAVIPKARKKPSKVFKNGNLSGATAAITKLMRTVIFLTLLVGFGYAAFVLTPPEKMAEMKVKVREWLKPGEVLNEYLPFKLFPADEDSMEQTGTGSAQQPDKQTAPAAQSKSEPVTTEPPVSSEEKSQGETPSATPDSQTAPDPTKRPAPAVSADQIAGDVLPPE